jgi:hypothetical protein
MNRSTRLVLGFSWAVFLAFLTWQTVWTSGPTLLRPMNVVVLLPLFMSGAMFGKLGLVAGLFVPGVFLVWCWTIILDGDPKVPLRSLVLLVGAILISACDLALGGEYALQYQSEDYLRGVRVISAVWWISLAALALLAKCFPNAFLNHIFHFALFAWLAWYALPYCGEMP